MVSAEIFCEGYHDRAFLAGWLTSRGWIDPGVRPDGPRKVVMHPTTGKPVSGGRFTFRFPQNDAFMQVVPAGGDTRALDALVFRAKELAGEPVAALVVALDLDTDEQVPAMATVEAAARERVETRLRNAEQVFTPGPGTALRLESGVLVHAIVWAANKAVGPGVPRVRPLSGWCAQR